MWEERLVLECNIILELSYGWEQLGERILFPQYNWLEQQCQEFCLTTKFYSSH